MWWILTALVLATPTPPRPVLTIVGPRCERIDALAPGATLSFTYQQIAQSCTPGGPCSVILREDLSARELELWRQGCEGPERGSFVRAGRRCGGAPVWRWRGRLDPGETYLVEAYPDLQLGRATVGGEARQRACPEPAREPLTRPFSPAPPTEARLPLTLDRAGLSAAPAGSGRWTVSLTAAAANTVFNRHVEGPLRASLTKELPPERASELLAGLRLDPHGRVRGARVDSFVRRLTAFSYRGEREECFIEEITRQRLELEGSALVFEGPELRSSRQEAHRCEGIPPGAWLKEP